MIFLVKELMAFSATLLAARVCKSADALGTFPAHTRIGHWIATNPDIVLRVHDKAEDPVYAASWASGYQ